MKLSKPFGLLLLAVTFFSATVSHSQATPTASQGLKLSTFGAATGVYTGLLGGRNISFTAGLDLGFRPFHGLYPTAEFRGTYPIHRGTIASEKSVLGGLRVGHPFGHLNPYVDFLAGRGEIHYENGGFTVHSLTYLSSASNVYSPGGGVDFDLSHHFSFKADYQYQFWSTPVTSSGSLHSNLITLGVVYHFDFNRSYSRKRK
jgi:opacity protein-like surface antigen